MRLCCMYCFGSGLPRISPDLLRFLCSWQSESITAGSAGIHAVACWTRDPSSNGTVGLGISRWERDDLPFSTRPWREGHHSAPTCAQPRPPRAWS